MKKNEIELIWAIHKLPDYELNHLKFYVDYEIRLRRDYKCGKLS